MVDSASQAEDSLEDDGDIRGTRTTPRAGSEARARLRSRHRFTCQATSFGISDAEPVRLGSGGRFTWQPIVFRSSAVELRKWFNRAAVGLNASGPRRHSAWQLKQRNSGQPGYSNLLQYLCLQYSRVFRPHQVNFLFLIICPHALPGNGAIKNTIY